MSQLRHITAQTNSLANRVQGDATLGLVARRGGCPRIPVMFSLTVSALAFNCGRFHAELSLVVSAAATLSTWWPPTRFPDQPRRAGRPGQLNVSIETFNCTAAGMAHRGCRASTSKRKRRSGVARRRTDSPPGAIHLRAVLCLNWDMEMHVGSSDGGIRNIPSCRFRAPATPTSGVQPISHADIVRALLCLN